jgi:amino acid adenylation domain-containing protein
MRNLRELKVAAAQDIDGRDYWLKKLEGLSGKNIFLVDHTTTGQDKTPPDRVQSAIEAPLFDVLMELSKGSLYTLHIVLLATLTALVRRYTGSRDVVVGTPIYRRDSRDELTNTALPIRNVLAEAMSFKELLMQVKQTVIDASQHPAYPVEILTELLALPVSPGEFPLFDIVLLVENIHFREDILYLEPNMVFTFRVEDGRIGAAVEFSPVKYEKATAERIINHLIALLAAAIKNMGSDIFQIDFLSEVEKTQLLVEFNRTDTDCPGDQLLHELFEEQVRKTPGNNVLHIPGSVDMTYGELNRRAACTAAGLQRQGIVPGQIAAIMTADPVEMITGILGTLMTGAAYLPVDPHYPQERIDFMLADSGAVVPRSGDVDIEYRDSRTIDVSASFPAYIIYTSGTTGRPRGVMVEHRSVTNTLLCRKAEYSMGTGDTALQLFSYAFDGFVTSFFTPVISGAAVVQPAGEAVTDMARIRDIIVTYKVTHFVCVPSLFMAIAGSLGPEDLASLKMVGLAGEELIPHVLKIIKEKNESLEIVHEYGVTEAAVMSTLYRHQERIPRITIGKPAWNTRVYILDEGLRPQPVGAAGELCIAGVGLARGYLNRPELTAEKFYRPYRSDKSRDSYKRDAFYRSGDLARWLGDGNIQFLGRIDSQVKIRGFRIEPGEIENRLLRHPGVSQAVVACKADESGDKYLCVYIKTTLSDVSEVKDYLSRDLPAYMIPSFFVPVKEIPLTPNGKVDRSALPEPGTASSGVYVPPRNAVEEILVACWAEILHVPVESIGIDSDFFKLGGHSLKAVKLIARVMDRFDVNLPMHQVFNGPTVRSLAVYIASAGRKQAAAVEPVEKKEYYPLSPMQKRLYILHRMEGVKTSYSMASGVIIEGEPDLHRFQETLRQLIRRHESLRTSFAFIDDRPVQVVHEYVEFRVDYIEVDEHRVSEIIEHFIAPFDLGKAPLLRAQLARLAPRKYLFLYDMHHIVSDGVSMNIFLRDFIRIYERKGYLLPELHVQYKDFSQWQNNLPREARDEFEKKENYWLDRFKGNLPKLQIYTDYPRPEVQRFEGDQLRFTFEKEFVRRIRTLVADTGTTLYMVLLAVYTILLARYSGQEDIVVGTPAAGREHVDFENTVGIFINSLPMRNFPCGDKIFLDFLREVKTNTVDAYENQGYPFGNLVEKVAVIDDLSRNPIFEAELLVQNMEMTEWKIEGLTFTPYDFTGGVTQSDIAVEAWESGGDILFILNYSTSLFKSGTMERFINHFREILSAVLDNPGIRLRDIPVSFDLVNVDSSVYSETRTDFEF